MISITSLYKVATTRNFLQCKLCVNLKIGCVTWSVESQAKKSKITGILLSQQCYTDIKESCKQAY